MQILFPPDFLWGASISSYQCEGNNFNCDWYLWEKDKKLQPAGRAVNHYKLFEEDFKLAAELNLNSLRFSVEWSRVSPDKDIFLEEELAHYKKVTETLRKFNLTPLVTLHHFTNPIWFMSCGGWLYSKNIDFFLGYLRKTVQTLKDSVSYWLIFNEPLVYVYYGFICGKWPPGKKSLKETLKVLKNITTAYLIGYQEIKNIYKNSLLSCPQISFAKHIKIFSACRQYNFGQNNLSAYLRDKFFNFYLIDYLSRKRCLDFVAVNYYCREYAKFSWQLGAKCWHDLHKDRRNCLDWYIYPHGLYEILIKIKKRYNLPVLITENGTTEIKDSFYQDYLISHLKSLAMAVREGVNVKGYLWWSLLDNFEWDRGFSPRFGLVEVDYNSLQRKIKPFAYTYAKICKANRLEIDD